MSLTLHSAFAEDKSLVSRVGPTYSITRATDGTYRDSNGTIQTAGSGVARFDHDASGTSLGLLVEEARTQQAIWTEDISNAAWVASNITKGTTSVTAPDGASNSNVRLTASAGNGTLLQTLTSASATRVYSVYMKRVTGTGDIDLTLDGGSTWTTKTLTSEWQRFDITQAAVTNPSFGVRIVTSGDAIDFWGSELNSGATFPASYISNNSATASVTRNADVVKTTDVTWFNTTEGSVYDAVTPISETAATTYRWGISDGTDSHRHIAWIGNPGTTGWVRLTESGSHSVSGALAYSKDNQTKAAYGYAADDMATYYDGVAGGTDADTGGAVPTGITTLHIGTDRTEVSQLNGHIAEIRYYNTRLSNAQLEAMSNGVFPSTGGRAGVGLTLGTIGRMGAK